MQEEILTMKTINVALLGFGDLGQSFAKLLLEKREEIESIYNTTVNVVAITTKTRGNIVDAWGIDLERVLNNIQETGVIPKDNEMMLQRNSMDVAETVAYDVLIEMTPLQPEDGHMATDHVKAALKRGKHVICANKGPLAWHYKELNELAKANNCKFLFESTVMDGTPVFSIVRENLKLCKVTEIKGIQNSTTNYVLQHLENGENIDEVVEETKKRGFLETNPKHDINGTEAATKMAALVNVLMDADITPKDIETEGIEHITKEMIDEAASRGNVIKHICRAYDKHGELIVKVGPEEISKLDAYAAVSGTSTAISITTDLMGTMTIIEQSPEIEQAGYGVFADLLTVIEDMA
jgi:homoserine dehydrogenase